MHVLCTFFLLLACPLAQGQDKPEAPRPKAHSNKVFIAGVSLLAASNTADAVTTRQLLDRGGVELNPIFGGHPSPVKQAGINAAVLAAQATAFYFTERSRHKRIRWTGRALIGLAIEQHTELAACNAGIDPRLPVSQRCRPYGNL